MKKNTIITGFLGFVCLAVISACGQDVPPTQIEGDMTMTGTSDQTKDVVEDDIVTEDMSKDETGDTGQESDATADENFELPPKPWDLKKMGPYAIGFRQEMLTYKPKPDEEPRTLRVAIWYPSRAKKPMGSYARYSGLLRRMNVVEGTAIAPDGPYPLLVFSHGNSGMAEQNYFMTEYFASHGWVVVSPDHTQNTFKDNIGAINFLSIIDRPQDISHILDWIYALPEGDALHKNLTEDIVMSGHSFGGVTTLAVTGATIPVDELIMEQCQPGSMDRLCEVFEGEDVRQLFRDGFLDPRIKVALPQTPGTGDLYRGGTSNIKIPTLMFTGARDKSLPNATNGDPLFGAMVGDMHRRVDFIKGGHFTFSNMCDLVGNLEIARDDGCSVDFVAPDLAYEIINRYSLAFAQYHLFSDMSHKDLLDGVDQPYKAEVIYTKK